MVISVRVHREGDATAEFADGRLLLAEEGHVAVTIHDEDRHETAVIMLSPEEATQLAFKLAAEARRGRTIIRRAKAMARKRDAIVALHERGQTPGARTYKEQGGPW